jgi:alkanesulfonate monooxygenase SsuD/methylene tetrahydromethanopterin reductase-like flavin-dependent oxidoreductase (luciferase family)
LANALATLDEASGGRAYMAIGSGASSVANASLARAKPKELAHAIGVFRSAFRGAPGPTGRELLDESVIEIKWAKRKVPVIVHASGPLGFELAAQRGDAVMLRLGDTDIDSQARQIADVRARHSQGLRAELPFAVWMYAPLTIANANSVIGTVSARAVTLKPQLCPPELLEAHRQYVAQYDYKFHGSTREPKNFRLLEQLGLAPYMIRRYSLSGGEAELQARLRDLERAGVTNLVVDTAGGDYEAAIASYGAFAQHYKSP